MKTEHETVRAVLVVVGGHTQRVAALGASALDFVRTVLERTHLATAIRLTRSTGAACATGAGCATRARDAARTSCRAACDRIACRASDAILATWSAAAGRTARATGRGSARARQTAGPGACRSARSARRNAARTALRARVDASWVTTAEREHQSSRTPAP